VVNKAGGRRFDGAGGLAEHILMRRKGVQWQELGRPVRVKEG